MQTILQCLKRRRCAAILITTVFIATIKFLSDDKLRPSYTTLDRKQSINTSCYYSNEEDALDAVDDNFSLPLWSIFFIESSCRGGLNSRQACSVESAARQHPLMLITVFFLAPVTKYALNESCLATLKQFSNIKFIRIRIAEFTKASPLASMISRQSFHNSSFPLENISNAFRYLILHKWGGIYLDTDIIVARNLRPLGTNWAGREDFKTINNAVLALSSDLLGTQIASDLLEEFQENYSPDVWGDNGPNLVTRVLAKKWCYPENLRQWSVYTCKGFNVYGPKLIYPVHYRFSKSLFKRSDWNVLRNTSGYTYHMWNHLTSGIRTIPKDSAYGRLAQTFCPSIFELNENK